MGHEAGAGRSRRWLWGLLLLALAASALPIAYSIRAGHAASPAAIPPKPADQTNGVACLGRIEPEGGVIHVAAAYLFGRPPVVENLYVKEGQRVRRGALIATLAGRGQLEASLQQAQARTAVAQRRIEQVKAGTKSAELAAQREEIARLEANLENAQSEFRRYDTLRRTGDVTASELEARRTAVQVAQHAVEEAKHRLDGLGDVPPGDIHLAEAQLQAAITDELHARREYELSSVYAPADGEVLKVHARPGEEIGSKGLVEMGRVDHMYVTAEVYETDIGRVHTGRRATISGDLLAQPVTGTVERVGMKVTAASVMPGDPTSFSDHRVIEVKIRLEDSAAVAGLTDGKVSVVIEP